MTNKTELFIQIPNSPTTAFRFGDTYLTASIYGNLVGLEFQEDISSFINVGDNIYIDKDDLTINGWIQGPATIVGITSSSIFPAPGSLVITNRLIQSPVFTNNESGTMYLGDGITSQWQKVDLSDNVPFPLTFNIADVREINNRNGAYSKTIQIPGTKNNNDVFKYIFDIQSIDNYDTRVKVKVNITVDTIPVLDGYIQLNSIQCTDNKYWIYECVIYGENANFSKVIDQNAKLEDLDFSEFNHSLTINSVTQSWDGDWSYGYYYPLIDYNNGRDPSALNLSGGVSSRTRWFLNYIKPSIYAKQYWDKIFKTYGYTYESEFLNSEAFTNLIIPTNKKFIESDPEWRFNSSFKAGITNIATYSTPTGASQGSGNSLFYSNMQNPEVTDNFVMSDTGTFFYDPQNVFQDVLGPGNSFRYTNSYQGTIPKEQKVVLNLDFKITPKFTNGASLNLNNLYGSGFILFYTITKNNQPVGDSQKIILAGSEALSGGSVNNDKINWLIDNFGEFEALDLSLFNRRQHQCIFDTSVFGILNNNDVLRIEVGLTLFESLDSSYPVSLGTQTANYDNVRFEIEFYPTTDGSTNGTFFFNNIDANITDNQPFLLNSTIPGNIKQIDFINSIVKMFNLYLLQDTINPNKIYIEPRDQFYFTNEILDWSKKLDISKEINQSPIVDRKKRVLLSYKEDKDFFNADYKQKTNEIYGQYEYLTNNELDTSDQKIEVIFSPSPMVNRKINNLFYDSRFIYTQILDPKQPITNENFNSVDSNIRILYRKKIDLQEGAKFGLNTRYPIITYSFDHYPYAGHLDDPFNSNLDLSFGEPNFLYYFNNYGYTVNNLYNEYYDQFFEEIYGKESKTITAYFYLTAQDIIDFNYRKLIYISNISSGSSGYFRVNKIEYDPFNKQSYKVELIKVLNNFRSAYRRIINIGDIGEALPDWGNGLVTSGDNVNDGDDNIIGGLGNSVNGNFNFVSGTENEIRNNSNNNGIIGSLNDSAGKNSFISGSSNRIGSSGFESSIIGGASGSLSGKYSTILGGFDNQILSNSDNNFIAGGVSNRIGLNTSGVTASVVNTNNFIIGGSGNIIESGITQSSTDNSFIIGGQNNTIESGVTGTVIINGDNFTATQSNTIYLEGNVLINGVTASGGGGTISIPANEIVFGTGTGVTSSPDHIITPQGSLIAANFSVTDNSSFWSVALASELSTIEGQANAMIASANGCFIDIDITQSFIASSNACTMSATTSGPRNTILGSESSQITGNAGRSTIIGSQNCTITGGVGSAIIGSLNSTITGAQRSAIIGGSGLSLTSNNTVLVPNLRVNDVLNLANTSGKVTINSPNFTVTVNNTRVSSNSIVMLTAQSAMAPGDSMYVDNIVPGVSFDITFLPIISTTTVDIAWMIVN